MKKDAANKIALSVDVEDWFHDSEFHAGIEGANERVIALKERLPSVNLLERPINDLLDFYDEQNIKATFFIVADLLEDYKQVFKQIVARGHEIGCHDLHHIAYTGIDVKKEEKLFFENIKQAKYLLEDKLNTEVKGFRSPFAYFHYWMVEILLNLGFQYDSSVAVNDLYNKLGDLKQIGLRQPFYWPASENNKKLMELPWPYWSIFKFRLPVGGGPAFRMLGPHIPILGLKQTLQYGDTSFYIHPLDISDEPLPELVMCGKESFWRNKGEKTFLWYKKVIKHFSGNWRTCKEIWQRNKENNIFIKPQ
ncbi:MAG: hypothetical protein A3E87_04995 [Gammaproteobacteria bacterium RIFCSPHIGHO2_12_FULL_35_23]|nr:MAG: hypothetical protein A3E87_04995 [Gammaproteobacteria bacterium RIFCSPHIGHO2_12_FULL_35_23]